MRSTLVNAWSRPDLHFGKCMIQTRSGVGIVGMWSYFSAFCCWYEASWPEVTWEKELIWVYRFRGMPVHHGGGHGKSFRQGGGSRELRQLPKQIQSREQTGRVSRLCALTAWVTDFFHKLIPAHQAVSPPGDRVVKSHLDYHIPLAVAQELMVRAKHI